MIVIFILVGGAVIQCTLASEVLKSYCMTTDFKMFGALASLGLVEIVFEMKHILAIFQKKEDSDVGDEESDNK